MTLASILPGIGPGSSCSRQWAAPVVCQTDSAGTSGKTGSRRPCGTETRKQCIGMG